MSSSPTRNQKEPEQKFGFININPTLFHSFLLKPLDKHTQTLLNYSIATPRARVPRPGNYSIGFVGVNLCIK